MTKANLRALLAWLMTPHAPSPRRVLVTCVFVLVIIVLIALDAVP